MASQLALTLPPSIEHHHHKKSDDHIRVADRRRGFNQGLTQGIMTNTTT